MGFLDARWIAPASASPQVARKIEFHFKAKTRLRDGIEKTIASYQNLVKPLAGQSSVQH